MAKSKIAISIDSNLLRLADSKVDGSVIRSRSQSIEYFLKKGMQESSVNDAVLLLWGGHQKISLQSFKGRTLIKEQISFFAKYGIKNLYITTQHTNIINDILAECSSSEINVKLINANAKGNATALESVKNEISGNFIAMSGDTYHNFDVFGMIKKHISLDKVATMGLMTREKPTAYGTAVLDGDLIVDFKEKSKHYSTNIVNAGIYIFKSEIFEFLKNTSSLEKDLFPKIAKIKQLAGFFTYGEYIHFGE